MRKNNKLKTIAFVIISIILLSQSACGKATNLNKSKPVVVTLWHYYLGENQVVLDADVKRFNETVGLEKGIVVEVFGYGGLKELEDELFSSASNTNGGSASFPNIFTAYADTVYDIRQYVELANINDYITDKEKSEYVKDFLDEGFFSTDELLILPVVKSTEVLYVNKTDYDAFINNSDAAVSLDTWENIFDACVKYYNWTDNKTPEIQGDGKAFFGIDSLSNYLIVLNRQMGIEIFSAQGNGKGLATIDKTVMKKLWDFYYNGKMLGYITETGRFRTDDVKTNEIIGYTASSSGASYFPLWVVSNDTQYDIEMTALEYPAFEDGEKVAVQQGAGMAVKKATPAEEEGSIEFIKWLADKDINTNFALKTGYIPVQTKSIESTELHQMVDKLKRSAGTDKNIGFVYEIALNQILSSTSYSMKHFESSFDARRFLEQSLVDIVSEDIEKANTIRAAGSSEDDILNAVGSEQRFLEWISRITDALEKIGIEYKLQ